MKKIVALLGALCIPPYLGGAHWIDNSFFMPKSQGNNTPIEMKVWNSIYDENSEGDNGVSLSLSPFYSASNNGHALGRYFFPNGSNTITVGSKIVDPMADVDPINLNLPSDFHGTLTFSPQRYDVGVRLDFLDDLSRWLTGLYWSVGIPLVYCEMRSDVHENILAQGTSVAGSPTSALNSLSGGAHTTTWNSGFRFGKISNHHMGRVGIADVDVKVGMSFLNSPSYKLGGHLNLIIPAGTHSKSNYLFEPMIGNAGHIGIGIGLNGNYSVFDKGNSKKYIRATSHQRLVYLLESSERRTLGLKNKPWGQYMRMRQQDPSNTANVLAGVVPGTTALTRSIDVTPGIQYDTTWALEGKYNNFSWSVGYSGWFRDEEKLKLRESFTNNEVYGLASSNGTLAAESAGVAVSSVSVITSPAVANGQFLTKNDIAYKPHPTASAHSMFLTVGLENDNVQYPFSALIGSSYTFPEKNTALEQWSLWATLMTKF